MKEIIQKRVGLFALISVGLIIIFGFYLRIGSLKDTVVIDPLRADAGQYYMYAYNLRHKHIYSREIGDSMDFKSPVTPDAVRSQGYPLFLALFVDGPPTMKIIKNILSAQVIISTLTIFIAFLFFKSFLSRFWAVVASFLVALSPHLIVANGYILTETLFCFLIVAAAWQLSLFTIKPSLFSANIMGILMGIASLVRPGIKYFPLLMIFFLILHYGKKKGIYFSLMMLLGLSLIFSPWAIRNIIKFKTTSDKRLMINFLHHGMYPDFTFDETPESYGYPYLYDHRSGEISRDISSVVNEISRQFYVEPLKHIEWFALKKPVAFWSWNIVQGMGDVFVYPVLKSPYFYKKLFKGTHSLAYFLHRWLILLCIAGGLMIWALPASFFGLPQRSIIIARFTSVLLIYFTFIHMIGAPFPRYSVPLRPFMYGMALFVPYFLLRFLKQYLQNYSRYPGI